MRKQIKKHFAIFSTIALLIVLPISTIATNNTEPANVDYEMAVAAPVVNEPEVLEVEVPTPEAGEVVNFDNEDDVLESETEEKVLNPETEEEVLNPETENDVLNPETREEVLNPETGEEVLNPEIVDDVLTPGTEVSESDYSKADDTETEVAPPAWTPEQEVIFYNLWDAIQTDRTNTQGWLDDIFSNPENHPSANWDMISAMNSNWNDFWSFWDAFWDDFEYKSLPFDEAAGTLLNFSDAYSSTRVALRHVVTLALDGYVPCPNFIPDDDTSLPPGCECDLCNECGFYLCMCSEPCYDCDEYPCVCVELCDECEEHPCACVELCDKCEEYPCACVELCDECGEYSCVCIELCGKCDEYPCACIELCDDCVEYPCVCVELCDTCEEYPCVCVELCDECGEYSCVCIELCGKYDEYPCACIELCDECEKYSCLWPATGTPCDECECPSALPGGGNGNGGNDSPQTGDATSVASFVMVFCLSASLISFLGVSLLKKKSNKK